MKFRIYQIYHLISIVGVTVSFFFPLMTFIEADGKTLTLSNFDIQFIDGTSSAAPVALGILLAIALLVMLFGLFVSLFQNFALQKRSAILSALLLCGYYILFAVIAWILKGEMGFVPNWPLVLPLVSLMLEMLVFWRARKAEASELKKSMDFRLRD